MRETYHPQPLRPSSLRITTLTHVIPAQAGIHPAASNSRRTAPIPPSTEIDTIRQSPTNHNEYSCPRARQRSSPVPNDHAHSRHSCTHPRHSRAGGNLTVARLDIPLGSCRPRTVTPRDQTEPQNPFD